MGKYTHTPAKGGIKQVEPCKSQFLSSPFLREMKKHLFSPIINCNGLPQFVVHHHFAIEGIPVLAQPVQRIDECIKIHLLMPTFESQNLHRVAKPVVGLLQG